MRPTSSTRAYFRTGCPRRSAPSSAGPSRASCGANSSIGSTSENGSRRSEASRGRLSGAMGRPQCRLAALALLTSCPCRTSGNTRGSRPGIWLSTAWRLLIDPEFAKEQLVLLGREWAMHPDGQLPACEWAFGDVNPPVHAWAAWQVYVIDGSRDREFLIRVCTEAAAEFQLVGQPQGRGWIQSVRGWIPRDGQYWFLRPLCAATTRISARAVLTATSWMAFFCLALLRMSAELAQLVPAWDDITTKFAGALPVHRPGGATLRLTERQPVG